MNINLRRLTAVTFLTICSFAVSSAQTQEVSKPQTRTVALITYGGDMAALISNLPQAFGVPIGLEIDPQKPHSYVTFNLREATLTDVLNAIVQSEPRYTWRANGDFIEVFPEAGSDPLLDVTIKKLELSDVNLSQAIDKLMNLPEVRAAMKEMNLRSKPQTSGSPETKDEKFSLTLEGVTLRTALHRIAKTSGQFWIFRRDAGGVVTIGRAVN